MSDCQEFPKTWEEFEQLYGFEDKKEIYTNRSRLIQSFRVKQWLDHTAEQEQKKGEWVYDGIRGRFPACKCSICGHYENADWALLQGVNYCPNCGADMRGSR